MGNFEKDMECLQLTGLDKILKYSLLLLILSPFLVSKILITKVTNDVISDNSFDVSKKLTTLVTSPSQCVYQCGKLPADKLHLRKFHRKSNKCECFQVADKLTDSRKRSHLMGTEALFLIDCKFV